MAHVDTLGGMVSSIKGNGRLVISPLGGLRAENCEAENCRIHTRFDGVYSGTLQLCNASVHVNNDYAETKRTFNTTEIVIDEPVKTATETRALGIEIGDIVCFAFSAGALIQSASCGAAASPMHRGVRPEEEL